LKYETYDELIDMVARFRNDNRDLEDVELDKLLRHTFKIDRSVLRDIDGITDLIESGRII
jgi:hypothetical protein